MCIFKDHFAHCTRKTFYEETNQNTNRIIVSYQVKGIEVYDRGPKFTWQLIQCLEGLLKSPNLLSLPIHRVQS